MKTYVNGYPLLSTCDENSFAEHQLGLAFTYITQILCCKEQLLQIKSKTIHIFGHAKVESPICCPQSLNKSQSEDFIIQLPYKDFCWDQMIYQLSHETNHVMMNCHPNIREYQWVSEVLCEMASQIVLNNLTINQQSAFAPNSSPLYFKDYYNKNLSLIIDNSDNPITPDKYLLQLAHTLHDPEHKENGVRKRNNKLAYWLLKEISFSRKAWRAVTHIEYIDLSDQPSYNLFFERWLKSCQNDEERNFVNTIIRILRPSQIDIMNKPIES